MNSIILIGNLTKDLELRYTPSGKAVAEFSVAIAQYKDKEGNWISDFFNCAVWGTLAENAAESLHKGIKVIVTGKLYTEKWEDREGNKRQSNKIKVKNLGVDLDFVTCSIQKNQRGSLKETLGETLKETLKEDKEEDYKNINIPF